uniref:PMEPCRF (PECTIN METHYLESTERASE PCR F) n=1 Tax=Arundo donax TaxID=35708 RepID=A0A0A9C328_ARUDO
MTTVWRKGAAARTKGGSLEGGVVVCDAAVTGHHGDPLAAADEHQVISLLLPHLHVYHRPAFAALRRRPHRVGHRGVRPRAVLRHHDVGALRQ